MDGQNSKLIEIKAGVIIHNLGSGNGTSVLPMIEALERASEKKIPSKLVANPAKANADFDGWHTKRGIDEIMQSAWKWQSENPHGYDEPPADM